MIPDIKTTISSLAETNSDPGDLKLRILTNVAGSSIVCLVIRETEDSFLVALPGKLMEYNGDSPTRLMAIQPYLPVKLARFFKSTLISCLPVYGEFELYYIEYLLQNGKGLYPEVITPLIERLQTRGDQLKAFYVEQKRQEESMKLMDTNAGYKH